MHEKTGVPAHQGLVGTGDTMGKIWPDSSLSATNMLLSITLSMVSTSNLVIRVPCTHLPHTPFLPTGSALSRLNMSHLVCGSDTWPLFTHSCWSCAGRVFKHQPTDRYRCPWAGNCWASSRDGWTSCRGLGCSGLQISPTLDPLTITMSSCRMRRLEDSPWGCHDGCPMLGI